jgi:threonine dehydrogenase-like Zn-dependent dehydrogenase
VGLAAVDVYDPVQFGQNVVIFGAGPIGLAATQGARAKGAGRIIVIDPVAYRRDLATNYGATHVFDPNVETDTLVARVREACASPTNRMDAGGEVGLPSFTNVRGGDLVVECSGLDWLPPKVEPGPDPTGLLALRQAWEATAAGGSLVMMAIQRGEISFPASAFCLSGKRLFGGQMAGMNVMRDTIRFIAAMEAGRVDIGSLITAIHPLTEVREGFQKVSDRTEVAVVFKPA